MALSIAEENYIKAIFDLSNKGKVTTNTLARSVRTKASSATDMLRRLSDKKLVNYVKYKGVSLTEEGQRAALKTLRKHRLWEVFLVEKLGFGWDEVHDVAEQLEHIRSPKLTEKLSVFLGNPEFDPHGDPIPNKDGELPKHSDLTLADCTIGDKLSLQRVKDGNPAFLQYLKRIDLNLGEHFTVKELYPFDGSVEIERSGGSLLMLSETVSSNLFVTKQ
jgi:DtxR family Mn-dependent transcriptional regulator